jgi:hypothetical protein
MPIEVYQQVVHNHLKKWNADDADDSDKTDQIRFNPNI